MTLWFRKFENIAVILMKQINAFVFFDRVKKGLNRQVLSI